MTIIGVDVSKSELVAVAIDRRGTAIASHTVQNQKVTIGAFLGRCMKTYPHLTVGSEATGEYHNILAKSCLDKGIPFVLLNPIVTKQFTRATVRKRKTDLTDAHVIAKCILQGEGERLFPSAFGNAKPILRSAVKLAEIKVAISHMARRFAEHHKDVPMAAAVFRPPLVAIEKSIRTLRVSGATLIDTRQAALLASIPGIGKSIAPMLLSEIGDIARFDDPRKLIAYAGLDPKVRQSGALLKRNTRITKRGSPYLRRAAYFAASVAQRHDPELRAYYEKKRGEGKRYKEATVANARHILNRVYAVWKRGTPYVKNLPYA